MTRNAKNKKLGLAKKNLLDRPHPKGYSEEWAHTLKPLPLEKRAEGKSVLIFRLIDQWLALPTVSVKEITERTLIHRLPHRSTKVLLGIVNVHGELRIAVSVKALLAFKDTKDRSDYSLSHRIYPRILVFGDTKNDFVFPVDEVYGVKHIEFNALEKNLSDLPEPLPFYTSSTFSFKNKKVYLLNEIHILERITKKHL